MTLSDAVQQFLQAGESQTVEFKCSFDRETIETLVAFANAQGGTVKGADKTGGYYVVDGEA